MNSVSWQLDSHAYQGGLRVICLLGLLLLPACSGVGIGATSDPYEKLAQAQSLETSGRIARARQLVAEATAIFQESGHMQGLSEAYRQNAFLIRIYGEEAILSDGRTDPNSTKLDAERADISTAYFEKSVAIEEQLGNYGNLSNLYYNIGVNYVLSDRTMPGCGAFTQSLAAHHEGLKRYPDRVPSLPPGIETFDELIGRAKQEAGCA